MSPKPFQMEDADNEVYLKEDQGAGKAAGHPLTMQ
jgi:hypothetical protein